MPKRSLVAANWKMNGDTPLLEQFARASWGSASVEVVFALPAVFLAGASWACRAAQDVSAQEKGAFTGEISAAMLKEVGCEYVILGHSERRQYHGEDEALLLQKWQRAQDAGLKVIYCVGESLAEYESQQTAAALERQLQPIFAAGLLRTDSVIAYEPVWAIGTGKAATADYAAQVHRQIRERLRANDAKIAPFIRLLYGGSVKASNAAALFQAEDVDGFLVGGASLQVSEFQGIIEAIS